jgi:metal-responsive CopG/Arc/MetJ family transcriptional regulator
MAKRNSLQAEPESDAKITIYARIDPKTVEALDEMCRTMRPAPSRSQLIDAACAEYVERHAKGQHRTKDNV